MLLNDSKLALVTTVLACLLTACNNSNVGPLPETVSTNDETENQQILGGATTGGTETEDGVGLNTSSAFAGIEAAASELGLVLRNSDDSRSLYTFDSDPNGSTTCIADCALTWPPLLADNQQLQDLASTQAVAEPFSLLAGLSIITRPDGMLQWAFNGAPLYRFSGDQVAGDMNGQGADDVWFVARPFAWQVSVDATNTEFFAGQGSINTGIDVAMLRSMDLDGLSLYTFTQDTFGLSTCNIGCDDEWPPFFADRGARASGGFSVITRINGAAQWAYNGQPLYFSITDANPGDTNGDGAEGVWFLARP